MNQGPYYCISANHVKYRRSLYQFYQMISCATNNNPLKYNDDGCFCGLGGQGTPVDNLDRWTFLEYPVHFFQRGGGRGGGGGFLDSCIHINSTMNKA